MAERDMRVLGVLACEGNPTGDSRMLALGGGRWPQLPLPLRRQPISREGHDESVVVGSIDSITRGPSGELMFRGKLFDTYDGRQAYDEMYTRYASSGMKYGVSIDPDDVMVELAEDEETMIFTSYRLRGATLVDIPAYNTAYVMLAAQVPAAMVAAASLSAEGYLAISEYLFGQAHEAGLLEQSAVREDGVVLWNLEQGTLVAGGTPCADAPRFWFSNPNLPAPTPLTITAEGRIFGHAATWNMCHIAYGDVCVTPPRSATNYAYFNTGVIEAEGMQVPVGHITMGTGHADPRFGANPAAEHYDNTGSIVADITVGEDSFGIWMAGAVRDGVTPEQVREMRAVAVSGDWRTINGNLELVAMLSVPVPGFPVPRMKAMVAGGAVQSLIASANFELEAIVEDAVEVVEIEHAADVAEVAPEEVVAALAEEVSVEEAPPSEDEAQDETPVSREESPAEEDAEEDGYTIRVANMESAVAELRAEIAMLREALMPAPEARAAAADPDAEPVEGLPAVENSAEDLLRALDELVGVAGKKSIGSLLAELDAKVG